MGEIIRQDPKEGEEKKGELPIPIKVWVSAGEDVGTMLNVTDMTYAQAVNYLRNLVEEYELVLQPEEEAQQEFSDDVDDGNIISTTPPTERLSTRGTPSTLSSARGLRRCR
mgnify:CR=1 FL=1